MIEHVWRRARASQLLSHVVIATDDERIADSARSFGADVAMTRADHPTGTDRVAEAARASEAEIIVNIQGDEPLIDPAAIDSAIACLLDDPDCQMATLKKRIERPDEVENPNVVKVVCDFSGRALYFSRAAIPHDRAAEGQIYWKHIGLYVYRRRLLLEYSALRPGVLEQAEKLEQLRALENSITIRVAETAYETIGVDTPEDLEAVNRQFSFVPTPTDTQHG